MSVIIDIADALVETLNAGLYSLPLEAARAYRPVHEPSELADGKVHVTAVPRGAELAAAGRGLVQYDVQVDLAIQKKLAEAGGDQAKEQAELDGLMGLVEEIADFARAVGKFGPAVWVKTANEPIYSAEHLGELRIFTSVLTLTLRAMAAN